MEKGERGNGGDMTTRMEERKTMQRRETGSEAGGAHFCVFSWTTGISAGLLTQVSTFTSLRTNNADFHFLDFIKITHFELLQIEPLAKK